MNKIIILNKKRLKAILLLFPALLLILYLCYIFLIPYALPIVARQTRLVPIYYVEMQDKKIAFSFDASWGAAYTPTILKILQENDITTTFFLTGFWVEKYPHMVKKIFDEGHEIGNHTLTHPHLNSLSEDQIKDELEEISRMIREITGTKPELFRPLSVNTATKLSPQQKNAAIKPSSGASIRWIGKNWAKNQWSKG